MCQTIGQRGSGAIPISPRTRRDRVATSDAFDRSTRYEIAFWQMAYTRGASDRA